MLNDDNRNNLVSAFVVPLNVLCVICEYEGEGFGYIGRYIGLGI